MRAAERNLVELLLNESLKVVERVELDLDLELKRAYPKNYEDKRLQLNQKHQKFQQNLDKPRLRKWNNIKQKEILSADCNTTDKFDIERKRYKNIANLLVKISRTLQITDIIGRSKTNFIAMLLNPLIHRLKKLQKVVRLLLI